MCINAVTILQEDLLPAYKFIKRHSEFEEYFILDCDHPSYYWNVQIYTFLRHSMPVEMTRAYKIVSTHDHEILGFKILSRIIHSHSPHIGGVNDDVWSDLSTPEFKNREQLEYFHSIILRLQQEFILSEETVSTTRLIFQYMKELSKSDKLKAFIATNMKNIITFLDKNVKYAVYTGGNIHGLYCYLEINEDTTTVTTSVQSSHSFGPSYSIKK